MRVVVLVRSLALAGAERQAMVLSRGLAQRGHQVTMVLLRDAGGLAGELHDAGVEVVELRGSGLLGAWRTIGRLLILLRRMKPDAIYGFMDAPNILVSLLGPIVPRARRISGLRASELVLADMPAISRALYRLEPRVTRLSHVQVANSQAGRASAIRRGFRSDRMVVIPNGVDTDFFAPDALDRDRLRGELEIPADHLVITRIGRLHAMKGYDTFLAALASLAAADVRFTALCVGSGPLERELHELTHHLGLDHAVRWLPARPDVRSIYGAADVVVSSSSYGEGLPNVVAEAMACDVPCVVTDVGDSAVLVGGCGEVVPPADPSALCAAIRRTLAARACDASAYRGRERVVALYSLDRMIAATEAVLAGAPN